MPNVAVNASSSGDNEILPAQGVGKAIHVLGYVLIAGAAVGVTFKDGEDNEYTGPMPFGVNGGVATAGQTADAWFQLPENTALILNLSGGETVAGHILYAIKGKNGS